jgi:hypothetical protein
MGITALCVALATAIVLAWLLGSMPLDKPDKIASCSIDMLSLSENIAMTRRILDGLDRRLRFYQQIENDRWDDDGGANA